MISKRNRANDLVAMASVDDPSFEMSWFTIQQVRMAYQIMEHKRMYFESYRLRNMIVRIPRSVMLEDISMLLKASSTAEADGRKEYAYDLMRRAEGWIKLHNRVYGF